MSRRAKIVRCGRAQCRVLIDLRGPKIGLGTFAADPVRLLAGQEFTITTREVPGDQHEAGTTYAALAADVRPGDRVLVDDGRIVLEVLTAADGQVRTRVVVGGVVSGHKGLNLPGVKVSVPAPTAKDEADLRWALRCCDKGDMVVIVAGSPPGTPGRTNALRVHRIGDAAALGAGLG